MKPAIYILGDPVLYRNYRLAVEHAGGEARFSGDPLECAGAILPGGGDLEPWRYRQKNYACREMDPIRDGAEMELLSRLCWARRPVLGICRGMQSINVFFGGSLIQDLPGHTRCHGLDRIHYVDTLSPFLSFSSPGRCLVNSAHHQAVERLGNGLHAVQQTPDGTVEALEHQSLPIWGVQWHPERLAKSTGGTTGELLFQAFVDRCRQEKSQLPGKQLDTLLQIW